MKRTYTLHRLVPAALRCAALLLGMGMAVSANAATVSNVANVTVGGRTLPSNTVSFLTVPAPSPATVKFFQYVPATYTGAGATPTPSDGTQCFTSGTYSAVAPMKDARNVPIPSTTPSLVETTRYHAREPVYMTLADANRNQDPLAREFVEVVITTGTGDSEKLRLQETGANTGLFAGALQSVPMPPMPGAPAVAQNDCQLSVQQNTTLTVDYVDAFYSTDTAQANVLVDPLGRVFDSATGVPVKGATVTLVDATTNLPATVFGDDGTTPFPATLTSGSTIVVGGVTYANGPGGYRFPFVNAGNYRLDVTPPAGFTAPSTVPLAQLQAVLDPLGNPYTIDANGSLNQTFTVPVGPALQIDLPVDSAVATGLLLTKTASAFDVSVGDRVQYRLSVTNQSGGPIAAVTVADLLPPGVRYEPGSLRVNRVAAADPAIGPDGRALTIAAGAMAAGAVTELTYIARIGTGTTDGRARNLARASAAGGLLSNQAVAEVRVRKPFMGDRQVLIGRVVEGACSVPQDKVPGVPGIKILLEDGTYVISDKDGLFHFEGVRAGTHVVQLDLATVPADMEVLPCIRNSRFAGRSYSQFVDLPGYGIWRTDFWLRKKPPVAAPVGVQLNLERVQAGMPAPADELYTLEANFASLDATLTPAITAEVDALVAKLKGQKLRRISITGHTDNAVIHPGAHPVFKNNQMLSEARAQVMAAYLREQSGLPLEIMDISGAGESQPLAANDTPEHRHRNRRVEVRVWRELEATPGLLTASAVIDGGAVPVSKLRLTLMLPEGVTPVPGSFTLDGAPISDPRVDDNVVSVELGESAGVFTRVLGLQATAAADSAAACTAAAAPAAIAKATLRYATALNETQAPPVQAELPCAEPRALARAAGARGESLAIGPAPTATVAREQYVRRAVPDEKRAAGYGLDWFEGAQPGAAFRFPAPDYNPRAPATRVAVQHAPDQGVKLFLDGKPVSGLNFDGTETNAARTVSVSEWTGVDLHDGVNRFRADIVDAGGAVVAVLEREVRWGGQPVTAEFVPEESLLAADGVRRPVIAVRFRDAEGRPVRYGLKGEVRINAPYVSADYEDWTKKRALAGLDQFKPHWSTASDDGVAYIELEPTTQTGEVVLDFTFLDARRERKQQVRTWLKGEDREWIVVGFAEGTAGYDTLKGNLQSLPADRRAAGRDESGVYTDGQVSFYAKGRVKGEWLLTMAYDTAKGRGGDRHGSLAGVIDPEQFYTLYGDGAQQRYDAASQAKLYLKLERPQFYALFGDYETGLTTTVLSRYSRALNGVKSEYDNGLFQYSVFGAETGQSRGRDEIPGNGTSGLYRLSRRDLVINSETVRIETRDRFRSEKIVQSEALVRHIDYDIDYANGTLFFRHPVATRDFAFNPNIIVAEYETYATGDERLNAGGRVGVKLAGGKLQAGVSAVRDEDFASRGTLGGVDVKIKPTAQDEIRLEGAATTVDSATGERNGGAHLAEIEHRGDKLDVLAYTRRQEPEFGVGQQNVSEAGTQKSGIDGRYAVTERVSVEGQAFVQDNLVSDATRNVVATGLRYQDATTGATLGAQAARDEDAAGRRFESDQVTAGVSQKFLGNKLELEGKSEIGLGGDSASVDYPNRYTVQGGYQVAPGVKLLAAHEITDGEYLDTDTSRVGLQVQPWSGATLDSTLNQQTNEYGPRTFGVLGLAQALPIGERWSVDFTLDRSQTFVDGSAPVPVVFNPAQPLASGSITTDDFTAATSGLTYRTEGWSWNGRGEWRDGQTDDRWGLSSGYLFEAREGVAFSTLARGFRTENSTASSTTASLSLSWAWRPLGYRYSILDRLELGYAGVRAGGAIGSATEASVQNLSSRKLVNNFALNRVSREWSEEDRRGNLFALQQRNQWTLYYGAKYSWDTFDAGTYVGYTDLTGIDVRHDLTTRWDIGAQGSLLHSWNGKDYRYSAGPHVGYTPMDNAWVSLGWNFTGFRDRDFDAANYTAEGPYLKLRFKFDQNTRLKDDRKQAQALDWDDDMSDEPRRLK